MESKKIYYQSQDKWSEDDYNALHRYLSKMVEHAYDDVGSYDGTKRINEIQGLSVDDMTKETKVLLYCSILSQNPALLDECDNLKGLKSITPLAHRLVLNPFKRSGSAIYRQYNVLY